METAFVEWVEEKSYSKDIDDFLALMRVVSNES